MSSNVKEEIIAMVREMPDDLSLEDVMEALFIRVRLEQGLEDLRAGRTYSQEEIEREFNVRP